MWNVLNLMSASNEFPLMHYDSTCLSPCLKIVLCCFYIEKLSIFSKLTNVSVSANHFRAHFQAHLSLSFVGENGTMFANLLKLNMNYARKNTYESERTHLQVRKGWKEGWINSSLQVTSCWFLNSLLHWHLAQSYCVCTTIHFLSEPVI